MSSDDLSVRLGIAELVAAYADCIDDDRLDAKKRPRRRAWF